MDYRQYNYRVVGHHIVCFGPLDFIWGLGHHNYSGPDCLLSVTYIYIYIYWNSVKLILISMQFIHIVHVVIAL